MWVRTTLTTARWTKEKTEPKACSWDDSRCRGAKATDLSLWQ
ncbi:PROCA1 isoform 3 [Pongo abelii]|uniref:PROCA1 isoform 3 n=1 Tax=Pongo abelii TaxID=9601 RepID=A0A2J8TMP4_PONAB|nr:PROCA1 isoform 3 [Pongo abelii]